MYIYLHKVHVQFRTFLIRIWYAKHSLELILDQHSIGKYFIHVGFCRFMVYVCYTTTEIQSQKANMFIAI